MGNRILRALGTIAGRRKREGELEREIRFHLEMEATENEKRGMGPKEAREAALRRFGGVDQVKEEVRDSWGVRFLDTLFQDVRFALRNLRKNPGFAGVVLLTLALGIGANTAMFSVINGVLLRSLPYANGENIVVLTQPAKGIQADDVGFSPKEIADYRAQSRTLDQVVEYHSMNFTLFGRGEAQRVQTGVVSANFFDVLGVRPLHGRTFVDTDDVAGAEPVLVLSHDYFQKAFGGDPAIVGQVFEMNDKPHTVIGVLPPFPQYPNNNDVYMPSSACPFRSNPKSIENRQFRLLNAFGRLKPGATVEAAQSDLSLIASQLAAAYPKDYPAADGMSARANSLKEELVETARPTILVLFGTTAFVLLLVCANVANLMLARASGRERELSLRMALGAGRARLVRQLLTESAILSLLGGALGLLFSLFVREMLVGFVEKFTPRAHEITIDGRVLLFALASSLVTGLVFGLVPALANRPVLATSINSGGRSSAGAGARLSFSTRNALIVSQVAISFILLTGAGLMVRSFVRLERVDPGFNPQNVLAVTVPHNWSKYKDPKSTLGFYRPIMEEIAARPGVTSVAITQSVPLNESQPFNVAFMVEGQTVAPDAPRPQVDFEVVSQDFFRTIGTPLLRGRMFTEKDDEEAPKVVLVNDVMARHHFQGDDPVGRRISLRGGDEWRTIVGVVGNVKQFTLDKASTEQVYIPFLQAPRGGTLLVRTAGDPWALAGPIREIIHHLDERQPLGRVSTLEQVKADTLASPRLTAMLIGLFALLALVITTAGIVGVVSYSVSQRTQEIGVRMALGADRSTVVRMVLRQGLTPVLIGLAAGVAGALALTKLITRFLFDVTPTDPITFAGVVLALVAAAALACWQPARRAAGIEPMLALRSD